MTDSRSTVSFIFLASGGELEDAAAAEEEIALKLVGGEILADCGGAIDHPETIRCPQLLNRTCSVQRDFVCKCFLLREEVAGACMQNFSFASCKLVDLCICEATKQGLAARYKPYTIPLQCAQLHILLSKYILKSVVFNAI